MGEQGNEHHIKQTLLLHNQAIKLSAEGGPLDEVLDPVNFDPEHPRATSRVGAVFGLCSQARDHIDAIRSET